MPMTDPRVITWRFPTSNQFRMGLSLPEAAKALGKLLGEKGIADRHPKLYERTYHRLKAKPPTGTIESEGAIEAIWKGVKDEFGLGEFDSETEWLISELIRITYAALEGHDKSDLESFTNALIAADAYQTPTGSDAIKAAGGYYRRALVKQNRVDYLGFSKRFPIDEGMEVIAATEEARKAFELLKDDNGPGGEDRANRVLVLWLTLLHRHSQKTLGWEEYEKQIEELQVIDRLWAAVSTARRGHPRAALMADNLTNLCSYLERADTRRAYVHLVVFDPAYRNPMHTVATDKPIEADTKHLRRILRDKPLTEEEIDECRRSLQW